MISLGWSSSSISETQFVGVMAKRVTLEKYMDD